MSAISYLTKHKPLNIFLALLLLSITVPATPIMTPGTQKPYLSKYMRTQQVPSNEKHSSTEPTTLTFNEFFESSTHNLEPSAKLKNLNHKRVRLTGFMAQMENEPVGSFFLVPRPVFCDEEGAGTADIPPEAVLVIVPFRAQQSIQFVPGLLEVEGTLEVGNKEDEGHVSSIRLTMDASSARTHQFVRSKKR